MAYAKVKTEMRGHTSRWGKREPIKLAAKKRRRESGKAIVAGSALEIMADEDEDILEALEADGYDPFDDWEPLPSPVISCKLAGARDLDWFLEPDERAF
jgi:hypothetical protein